MIRGLTRCAQLICGLGFAGVALAQVPADPSNYARTTSFTYNADGTLHSTTVEPDNALSCHVTTVGYDLRGNVDGSTLANCTGAAGTQLFDARSTTATFDAVASQTITTGGSLTANASVAVPAGLVQTAATNALTKQTLFEVDPRFGVATKTTDIDQRVSRVVLDDFGRPVKQVRPDGTSVRSFYCVIPGLGLDTSASTSGCPTTAGADAPPYAVHFVQTEPHDIADAKMGAFTRVYVDRLGRTIRTVTESFDGDGQPAARKSALIVSDVVYDANGAKVMETKPYFLGSGSTTVSGSNDVGVTMYVYDAMGRAVTVYVADPDATTGHQLTFGAAGAVVYGSYGTRTVATTVTTFNGTTSTITNDLSQVQVAEHDARDQVRRKTDANGAQLAFQYDAFGNVIRIVDALQNTILSTYDIQGAKTSMNDPDHGVIVYCFDVIGQLKAQQGSAMRGTDSAVGCPTDLPSGTVAASKAGWTTTAYDKLGRPTHRIEPDLTSTWSYDSCANGVGELCQVTASSGSTKTLQYDGLGRLVGTRLDVAAGPSFASAVAFDATTGRLSSTTYPSGVQVGYMYSPLGYEIKLQLNNAATLALLPDAQGQVATCTPMPTCQTLAVHSVLWSATTVDADARWETQAFGNGVTESVAQNPSTGRIWTRKASVAGVATVLDQSYTWDGVNNVRSRTDNIGASVGAGAVTESFLYDALNRLSSYAVSSPGIPNLERDVVLQYNALGMLLSKTDVGNYAYGAAGARHPHALASNDGTGAAYGVDLDGNVLTATTGKYRTLTYTSFDNVATAQGNGSNYTWLYDESHSRMKETRTSGGDVRVTWYLNPDNAGALAFEVETDTSPAAQNNRHYLTANGNVIGVLVTAGSLPTLQAGQMSPPVPSTVTLVKVEYWHKDHLGSLAATTDQFHNVTARYSYDPFGKRRFGDGRYDLAGQVVADWSPSVNFGTARGFTGHEQLDDIGIVNMNGRLYDASLGMFVQADPRVTVPDNLQSYNRYAYVLNNPLNATDPTGFDNQNVSGENPSGGSGGFLGWLVSIFSSNSNSISGGAGAGGTGSSNNTSDGNTTNQSDQHARLGCGGVPCPHKPLVGKDAKREAEIQKLRDDAATQRQIIAAMSPLVKSLDPNVPLVMMRAAQIWEARANYLETGHFSDQDKANLVVALIQTGATAVTARVSSGGGSTLACNCCFVAGTPVLVDNGSLPIEAIQVGTLVQSRDETTGMTALKPVTQLIRNDGRDIYALVLLDSKGKVSRIEASDNHPFWVIGLGWRQTVELVPGMHTLGFDNMPVAVASVTAQGRSVPTYNFTVADFHTFFAGEIPVLVHNAGGCCAASSLPQMKGMGAQEREAVLKAAGFSLTRVSNSAARNEKWNHQDNSEVRVHPYGGVNQTPYKSGNNAHIHKEDSSGNQLNDRGQVSTDRSQTHIGLPNPPDFQAVRGRQNGQ